MGGVQSTKSKRKPYEKDVKVLREKVKLLETKVCEIMLMRENESRAFEQEMMVYDFKEAEWKGERMKLREEVKKLRKMVEIKGGDQRREQDQRGLVEMMKEEEERACRDEAVERWKKLYLAIKVELDDLIHKIHQGENLYWRAEEEDMVEELQRELKARDEAMEILQARLASMEQEETRREREMDILRQSLRIMCHNKKTQEELSFQKQQEMLS